MLRSEGKGEIAMNTAKRLWIGRKGKDTDENAVKAA
jgi:hypothetical protein